MPTGSIVDSIDAELLKAQTEDLRATVIALADMTSLSRNTVQARLSKLAKQGVLHPFERRIDLVALGYPLTVFILTGVTQRKLTPIAESMDGIPKAIEVHGRGGVTDVLIHVVARDGNDFYHSAGRILDIDGVEQATTALVVPQLAYRLNSPLAQLVDGRDRGGVIKCSPMDAERSLSQTVC
ncbi:Lrp/AsnC family transcriptional regulator [Rhodococcus opacus]|uniref:Lrp/AsnC family transcriptional regulator n=1 Tax=Rhodococcus opacus TaxID=37919 RepID=UPI001F5474D6|nr:Lrp/AsnC family transcriptional regulator [Rhodococcus opacus]